MSVIINPGSGPVAGATREQAETAIDQFIRDLDLPAPVAPEFVKECRKQRLVGSMSDPANMEWVDDGPDGRFEFLLTFDGNTTEIEMPGLAVEKVRYLGEEGQSIWDFPRLYVDGSSWVWEFAITCARASLTGGDDDE